jgi:hypothetical protein
VLQLQCDGAFRTGARRGLRAARIRAAETDDDGETARVGQRYVPGSWHGCGFRFRAAIEENHMEQALGAFEKVGRDQELSRDQELI